METRQPILMAACGKKGVGKSYTTMQYMRDYVKGDPANGLPGRKVLIFDVNNEYSDKSKFPDIRAIAMKDVQLYSAQPYAQIRRIAPFFDDGRRMSLNDMADVLQWLVRNFFNGLLLVEDINKYVSDSMPSDLIGAICTNRHSGVDIILHYQSIGRLTPKVWQNINVMRMHKNTEGVDRHKKKFEDKEEYLKIAENIIHDQYMNGNKRYYLYINFDDEKVYPELPRVEVEKAISRYISDNYQKLIVPMLNARDAQGRKIYDEEGVFVAAQENLYEQYFSE